MNSLESRVAALEQAIFGEGERDYTRPAVTLDDSIHEEVVAAWKGSELYALASITPQPDDGWISVEDRMPEEKNEWSESVLVCLDYRKDGGVCVVTMNRASGGEWQETEPPAVTHWMPLPDPPENPRSQDSAT